MNLTAPMQPKIATIENQIAIKTFNGRIKRPTLELLAVLLALRCAKAGNTKSKGVKPIAPQMDTKSPKNGMAAAIRVTRTMYMEVKISRASRFLKRKWLVDLLELDATLSSK